jgi:hypothetical protein
MFIQESRPAFAFNVQHSMFDATSLLSSMTSQTQRAYCSSAFRRFRTNVPKVPPLRHKSHSLFTVRCHKSPSLNDIANPAYVL